MKRRFISGLLAGMMAVSLLAGLPEPVKVSAKTVSGLENANINFDTYNSLTPNWYYKVLR